MDSINPVSTILSVDQPVENNLEYEEAVIGASIENPEDNLLKCTVCHEEFSSLIKLQRHYIKHVINKPFQCEKCDKNFFTKSALQKHNNLHIKKPFSCPICSNRFKTETDYQKHLSIHKLPNLVCNACFQLFSKSNELRKHEKCHTSIPERPSCYLCIICKEQFMIKHDLEDHLNKHQKFREFTCKECDATFFFSYLLQNHKQTHTAKEVCNICSEHFQSRHFLSAHERIHLRKQLNADNVLCFTCELCNATFPFKSDLEAHLNDDHDGAIRYPCTVCEKTFFFSYMCRQHKITHMEAPEYQCSQCCRKFRTEKLFNLHMVEIHYGQKKFECPQCGKLFSKKYAMQQHCNSHNIQIKYCCGFCNSTFTRKDNLERHYQVHMNKKLFKCDKCDSNFSRKDKLCSHLKLHESDHERYDLRCNLCDKGFVSNYNLNQHIKKEHPKVKKVFICEICGKTCPKSKYSLHYKKHSGEKPYKCKYCDKRFIEKKYLYPHHKRKHPGLHFEIDLPFKCDYCNEAYLLKKGLLIHHKKCHSFFDSIL